MEISKRIKAWREAADLTQEELARQLGVTASAVCHWERGDNRPDFDRMEAIARACGVSHGTFVDKLPRRKRRAS